MRLVTVLSDLTKNTLTSYKCYNIWCESNSCLIVVANGNHKNIDNKKKVLKLPPTDTLHKSFEQHFFFVIVLRSDNAD